MKSLRVNSILAGMSVVLGVGGALLTIHGCEDRYEAYDPPIVAQRTDVVVDTYPTSPAPGYPPDLIYETVPAHQEPVVVAPDTLMLEAEPAPASATPLASPVVPMSEGDVLTRGPLHEAFGEPITNDPQAGMTVAKMPPAPVQELPPEMKPVGDNVVWIPGYWWWDEELDSFIWVTGLWRTTPPNSEWVPGYWTPVTGGYQWVSGFWKRKSVGIVQYLPAPPESLEVGPSSNPPGPDYIWVPGYWRRIDASYVWQAGGWMDAQPDWVWVPAHYLWTPRGYVFVHGYWDHPFERRGLVFAPVFFRPAAFVRPVVLYQPTVVIETRVLTVYLFSRPRYRHYYFGNYFEIRFTNMGIVPWFSHRVRDRWYDPHLVHCRWDWTRRDSHWEDRLRRDYDYRYSHIEARPPITLAAQRTTPPKPAGKTLATPVIATRLSTVATTKTRDSHVTLTKLNRAQLETAAAQGQATLQSAQRRQKYEATAVRVPVSTAPSERVAPTTARRTPEAVRPQRTDARATTPRPTRETTRLQPTTTRPTPTNKVLPAAQVQTQTSKPRATSVTTSPVTRPQPSATTTVPATTSRSTARRAEPLRTQPTTTRPSTTNKVLPAATIPTTPTKTKPTAAQTTTVTRPQTTVTAPTTPQPARTRPAETPRATINTARTPEANRVQPAPTVNRTRPATTVTPAVRQQPAATTAPTPSKVRPTTVSRPTVNVVQPKPAPEPRASEQPATTAPTEERRPAPNTAPTPAARPNVAPQPKNVIEPTEEDSKKKSRR